MKKLEIILSNGDIAKLDDLVRERQNRNVQGVTTRADIIGTLILVEWLALKDQASAKRAQDQP